jgi:hypothetical protein
MKNNQDVAPTTICSIQKLFLEWIAGGAANAITSGFLNPVSRHILY